MSAIATLQEKIDDLKTKVSGDLHDLVKHIEAAVQHLHTSHTETVVKDAVVADLSSATDKVANIANTVRMESDLADKAVDAVDDAVKAKTTK